MHRPSHCGDGPKLLKLATCGMPCRCPIQSRTNTMVKDWGNRLICRIDVTGFLSIQVALLAVFMAPVMIVSDGPRIVTELPKAHHAISMPRADREDALIVAVIRDGKI